LALSGLEYPKNWPLIYTAAGKISVFFCVFIKRGHFMSKKKTLDQLRLEKERAELRLAQEQSKITYTKSTIF